MWFGQSEWRVERIVQGGETHSLGRIGEIRLIGQSLREVVCEESVIG